jgi:DNA-binding CsgD family transcriptional regulator
MPRVNKCSFSMKKYSEKELITLSSEQVNQFGKEIVKEISILEEFTEFFPCFIHLNNYSDLAINYLNKYGLERFEKSLEEIVNGGVDFIQSVVHPSSTEVVVPILFEFIKSEQKERTLFYEQKVRYTINKNYKNHLSFSTMSETNNSLLTFSFPAEVIEEFIRKRIFKENPIDETYIDKYSNLTKREKEVLKYVVTGKTNNEIGEQLCLSKLTVKTHRQNINKKLGTNKISELTRIASYFDIIKTK